MAKMILMVKKNNGINLEKNMIRLENDKYRVGRQTDNDICLNDLFISREHAVLNCKKGKWYIQDLGSKNGTFVNEIRLGSEPFLLTKGDIIDFGKKIEFVYEHEIVNFLSTQASYAPVSPYGIEIDYDNQDVYIDSVLLSPRLSPKEFLFLSYMMQNPNRIAKYEELYAAVYSERAQPDSDYFDPDDVQKSLYIVADSLRKKLKKQNITRPVLKARNNVGYQIVKKSAAE